MLLYRKPSLIEPILNQLGFFFLAWLEIIFEPEVLVQAWFIVS